MMPDQEKDWIFISDAHFTGQENEEMESFLKFLDREKGRIGYLVILGDLFEFFFGFKKIPSSDKPFPFAHYLPVLKGLQGLHQQGVDIKYFEGNHDFFLRSFFSQQFGMEIDVHPGGAEERLGGKRAFVAHGDLSNSEQWNERAIRKVLKNRLTYGLIHLVGPRFSQRVAKSLSRMSYRRNHQGIERPPPPAFRKFAHRKFLEGFDIVILGHSHFPEEVEEWVDGKKRLYFNVGAWVMHRSFLRFTPPDRFRLSRFEGEGGNLLPPEGRNG